MKTKIEPLSLKGIFTYSLKDRPSKVSHQDFGRAWEPGGSFAEFVRRLPRLLAGETLAEVAGAWVKARSSGRLVLLGMGAHPLKMGLSPILIDLLRRGLITGVAMNGAGIIHDAEIAMVGRTSEDVDQVLGQGQFGMAKETAEFLNAAIATGAQAGLGLGEAVGRELVLGGPLYQLVRRRSPVRRGAGAAASPGDRALATRVCFRCSSCR